MGVTPIEWVRNEDGTQGRTINPIRARDKKSGAVGHFCIPVSPGCANCYASRLQSRFQMHAFEPANRKRVKLFLDDDKLREVLGRKAPTAWFWEDMSDLFFEDVPFEWIIECFAVMHATPHHRHYVLTKRVARALEFFRSHVDNGRHIFARAEQRLRDRGVTTMPERHWPLRNVRFGASMENQPTADERLPLLLRIPAAWRYVSYEPALGPVTWVRAACSCRDKDTAFSTKQHESTCAVFHSPATRLFDAIIIGGESGGVKIVRPFYLGRARSTIRQCHERGTAVFLKQMGSFPTMTPIDTADFARTPSPIVRLVLKSRKGGDMSEFPAEYRVREGF